MQPASHAGSTSSGRRSRAVPRSAAIERSPSGETREQIVPLRPTTGPRISTPNAASRSRTSMPASSAPVFPRNRDGAPSSLAQAATFAAWPPGPTRISASVSPPAAIGAASRTTTSSVRSPSVQTSMASVIVRSGRGRWRAAWRAANVPPRGSRRRVGCRRGGQQAPSRATTSRTSARARGVRERPVLPRAARARAR